MTTYPIVTKPDNTVHVAQVVNNVVSGSLNVTSTITLTPNDTTTTLMYPRIHPECFIGFMAITTSASIAQSDGLKVVIVNNGRATIHHNAYTDTDMKFRVLIIG